ncbi:uncharacterized protein LOC123516629 isoform X2 [Portunus trituberculatus]|uniref:uncharacterized protein LOC123516629 isoform X2 n=1 Tax=Portunus trituberculatus TaxID=210409 RepID=UPI001E1CB5D8|nr:uncharacterized protein LOC123516629 isoform X2 [Portunus trituberculatus]
MNQEWTYRPPVLVGERVVWLGGDTAPVSGEHCNYQPHHGTVSWIGRVSEIGNDWIIGVEFELDMAGGCDGTWKGRQLFSCPKMRGLFLPVASVIKEKDFYTKKNSLPSNKTSVSALVSSNTSQPPTNTDLSLAPEPPPSKNKMSHHSPIIHSRNTNKQNEDDLKVSSRCAVENGGEKTSHHHMHKSMGATSMTSSVPSSTGATVITPTQCSITDISTYTSKKQLLAGRHVNTGAQDTSWDCSFSQEKSLWTVTSGSVTETGAAQQLENEGDFNDNFSNESLYFGETMIRKSTLTSKAVYNDYSERVRTSQPSISTPSSPSLSEYQRHYGKKSSYSSTSTIASDLSKCMSTPGRYSSSQSPYSEWKERSGFFGIFRWFRNKKKRSASIDGMSNTSSGSMNSLSSTISSSAYSPIIRSRSADIQNKTDSKQGQFGMTRRYKLFSKSSSGRGNSRSSDEENGRRLSVISACSDTSSRPGSRGATLTRKKRPAPQPPNSPKLGDSESLKSQKSCASLPNRDLRPVRTPEPISPASLDQDFNGRKLHKSKSEGVIYSRVKRRAPLPPAQAPTGNNSKTEPGRSLSKESGKSPASSGSSKDSDRPISTVSNVSSLSQSLSSASTTLKSQKSQSSSITSSGPSSSQCSSESVLVESGVSKQDLIESPPSPAIADSGKVSLSPRPWYKRKNKNKDTKNVVDKEKTSDCIYDTWMPEIQFARQKLSLGGSLKKGGKTDGKCNQAPHTPKEEKKEKRKSQVSLLASISELDRAASEQMQREQENKQAQKQTYDNQFYRTSEPHFLTQTDFLPQPKDKSVGGVSDIGTLSPSGSGTIKSSASVNTEMEEQIVHTRIGLYDNLSLGDHDFTLPQSYSKQTTLKMEEREDLQHLSQAKVHPIYNVRSPEEETNSKEINFTLIDNRRSIITHQNVPVSPESSTSMTRDSPLHRATIDAELFYRLAKDSQSPAESKVKNSPVLGGFREMKKVASTNGHITEEQAEDENVHTEESPKSPRRQNKNFGFRMNNFFSPDVSTIIEASESMTSSATTPADDIYEDLPILSVAERGRRESFQDEINSEQNCDFQLNSSDAREIMRELADVRQEIEKINEEEEKEFQERQRTKADKIREEVLHLREANNFIAWHSAVEQNNCGNIEVTPSPVNVNGEASRKFKWVCDMCTLNNTPWRLQCEACLARRPANPKRVDDDGKSLTSDFVSPQASVSNESPVTVIFEDGNNGIRECPREVLEGAGAIFPSNAEPLANEQSCPVDKKKDINWEKELQKYFRTFDEHVKGNNSGKPTTKSSKDRIPANKEVCSKNTQKSGKESDSIASNNQVKSDSENKGAKPKMKFFGTATGPPSTFIAGNETSRETNENTEQVLSLTIKESHTNESLQKEPDMEAIRKARLAKFQERNVHVVGAYVPPDKEKKTRIRNHTTRVTKNSILEGQELNRVTSEVNDSSIQRNDSSELSGPENKMQESSFSKSYCKPQVMKPSGAVRAAVSIFNQFEQLQHANKEKPAICRRKLNSSLFERTRAFEHVYPEATSPESERCSGGNSKSKSASNCPREKEVFSAIAKFDEMAAIAELESIDKFRQKSKVTRRPKLLKISVPQSFQTNDRSNSSSNTVNGSPKMRRYTSSSQSSSTDINDLPGNAHHASKSSAKIKETSEGVIMDGVLYTEHRKHSMSISSSTFELIQAEDFVNIEAQHSESSTYSDSRGITDVATSSTQSSSKVIEVSGIITEHMNDDRCRIVNDDSTSVAPETRTEPQVWPLLEPKDVDRLSHQLTEADGIATFKANLRVEEPALGQTNTLHIGKLLKKLEAAISRGNHAEAAKLAHELADFRVSCSVTRNNKNENRSTSAGSSTTQVNLSSNCDEARQLAPIHSDAESSGMQASSNISECYYDATEVMEVDELSTDDHDNLLDMASVNNLEKLVQQKENPYSLSKLEDSSEATTNSSVLPQPKQILEIDSSHESFNGTEAQEVDTETETVPNMQETPKITYSPSAARREIKVDPARREVKSDTITKLPDGLHVHMKENKESNQPFYVKMYVEDKNSHQGPLSFAVTPTMTVGQLREKVCQDFGFPPEVQRWILGKRLADDDQITLEHHRVTSEGCPIFLYLVAPELESQANASTKKKVQGKSNYGENSQELGASGGVAIDKPRYLKVYDDEGNVEYRYYNPDSRKYEVSTDIDGSDGDEDDEVEEEEEEEEGDDEYDDEDDDDTLEEDEIEENKADMEKLYENINQNEDGRYKQRTLGYDAQDVKYSLQPPVTTHRKTNDVNDLLNQKILLNGYSGATNYNQVVTSKSNNFNLYANESVPTHNSAVSKEIEHKSRINFNQSGRRLDVENSNGNELAVANEKKQDNLQHKCQSQQPQPHVMQGHSGAGSSLQPQLTVNDNENSAPLGKSLQKKDYDTKQNDKVNQQRQIFQKEKSQNSQLSEIGYKLAMKSQPQQNSKNHEMQLPSETNKQQLSEPKKQESSHQQTPNKSSSDAQPNESQKELPSTSRGHGWVCPSCTLVNKWSRPGCEACATERPGTSHQVAGAVDKGSGLGAVVSVLDRQGYVPNPDPFECRVCFMDVDSGKGVVLRDCLHTFCRDCLANGIKYSDTADVKCPYRDSQYSCDSSLQDREIKALLTAKEYEQHLNKSVKQAEGAMQNVFHCKTPDCPGFCQFEDNVNEFHCDVCGKDNCLTCQAQHGGTTCQEYQDDLANKVDEAAMKTKKFFDDMIRRGDGLPCPKCSVMLVRKWGCDWMRCPMCRTEICWVTRGPRWGPGGPGDVSGGCKCGIRGQKCHPKCTYCH